MTLDIWNQLTDEEKLIFIRSGKGIPPMDEHNSGLVLVEEHPKKKKRADKHKNKKPLPEPAVYYDREDSRYPDRVRLSFPDGHTEIYDKRVNQPRPDGYLNWSGRRRQG